MAISSETEREAMTKLRMHRSCNGCSALVPREGYENGCMKCELGYPIIQWEDLVLHRDHRWELRLTDDCRPMAECPKGNREGHVPPRHPGKFVTWGTRTGSIPDAERAGDYRRSAPQQPVGKRPVPVRPLYIDRPSTGAKCP